ncbi:ATP-binding protein [Aquipuribacter nitratireducens]|uniref:ATP-binding protein n=1 Tax=Aquipuribacter nitratireducens TaxID=650104 RepID=A0ABW0GQ69_9MICO
MDQTLNPYTPGAGKPPPALVGREAELDAGRVVVARTARGTSATAPLFYGLRGVGKTVLLKALHAQAETAGWLTVEIEGKQEASEQQHTRRRLARGLVTAARATAGRRGTLSDAWKRALGTISSFSVAAGATGVELSLGVDPMRGRGDTGDPETDLEELVRDMVPALKESGIGLGVFVDEIQDLDPATLSALISVQHRAGQNGWPFHLYGAGLPNVPARLAEVRSYSERFHFVQIGALSDTDARAAFADPALQVGVEYEAAALDRLVQVSGGYPYFVQVFGDQAWRLAPGPQVITREDADVAVAEATAVLDDSLFHSRWNRATPAQKALMRAMAEDSGHSQISDLVARMGKRKPSDLSVTRDGLIKKGLIYAPDRGLLQFTVPHMDDYIRRQHET